MADRIAELVKDLTAELSAQNRSYVIAVDPSGGVGVVDILIREEEGASAQLHTMTTCARAVVEESAVIEHTIGVRR